MRVGADMQLRQKRGWSQIRQSRDVGVSIQIWQSRDVGVDTPIEACRRESAEMQSRPIFMPVKEFPGLEIRVFRSASVRRADKEGTFGSSVYVGDNRFIIDSGFQSGCRVALPLFL